MVWAAFGMTATEMGFTEDAKGNANQIVQTGVARRKIIYPIVRLLEYYNNTQIIPEFGFEGIRFKYKMFDIDEETRKWTLYKLQTEADLKTINEVRNTEGLDPVEWGDKNVGERSPQMGTNINLNDPNQTQENRVNNENQDKRDAALVKPKKEKKALDTESPLTLGPNEELDDKNLERAIVVILNGYKKKVIEVLESQVKKEPLVAIKGVDDIPGIIEEIFVSFGLDKVSGAVIKNEFDKGWDYSEKKIDQNVQYNQGALKFLQNHVFDNIKGMTEEIANDLKAELQRGIINGEGLTKLKKRVEKVFNVGDNRAEMIARTETNRALNQGKLLAMKGSGIEMQKRWLTHKDDRTSPICNRLDGQTVGLDEDFKDSVSGWTGQANPSHVNCRSTILFIEKHEEQEEDIKKKEKFLEAEEEVREKYRDKEIKLKLQEKDAELKARKEKLLKNLESDLDGGD